jgi:deoxyribonuclease V
MERRTAMLPVSYPYVPGLLTYREAPAALKALEALECEPDLLMFDGQGYAHPRRMGLASHLGLILARPSIGCAKSRLYGTADTPGPERGASCPLVDQGEIIGAVVRTRARVRPVYVSTGHLIDLDSAVSLVLETCRGYRLPEPTRLAHRLSTQWVGD